MPSLLQRYSGEIFLGRILFIQLGLMMGKIFSNGYKLFYIILTSLSPCVISSIVLLVSDTVGSSSVAPGTCSVLCTATTDSVLQW